MSNHFNLAKEAKATTWGNLVLTQWTSLNCLTEIMQIYYQNQAVSIIVDNI